MRLSPYSDLYTSLILSIMRFLLYKPKFQLSAGWEIQEDNFKLGGRRKSGASGGQPLPPADTQGSRNVMLWSLGSLTDTQFVLLSLVFYAGREYSVPQLRRFHVRDNEVLK